MPDSSRYAYRRHDDAFAPTREDLAGLRDHVRTWAEALGIRIRAVEVPEDIEDEALRAQFSKRRRVKGWYDSSADEVCVYLPNIALDVRNAYGLLDRTLLHEIVGHKGLMGLLGRERFAAYCDALWGKMSEPLRQRFIMYVDGDAASAPDRRAAAAEFVAHAAEDLEGPDWERAHGRWGFAMKVLSETFPELAEVTSIPENISYDALAKALRFLGKAREYKMPEVSIDELSDAVDREIDALDGQFRGIVRRDYDKTIRLGRIFPAILNSSERSRDLPMELRTNAFFGSEYDDKQERHPFRASDLHGIVKGLRKPLAVFVSKQKDKPDTTVVLLPNTSSASGEPKHFVAILTPIENRDGVPVMNIDSVYPKRDRDLIRWIGTSYVGADGKEKAKLLRYMGEGFFKWFADVSERLLNESERGPETIKSHSERQSNSAEVGVRLTDQTDDSRRIRAELLRATNIVINFDNPKIPGEKFRIFHKMDSEPAQEVDALLGTEVNHGTTYLRTRRDDGSVIHIRYYGGSISPEPGVVFVFGSNPEGRHGAGAAKVARERFGAVYGQGEGLQGNAYAIPTKDLGVARRLGIYSSLDSRWEEMKRTVLEAYANRSGDFSTLFTDNPYPRSVSPETIVASIVKMYGAAEALPERTFAVAYTNGATEFSMNGYCGAEMAEMFSEAGRRFGRIPQNVSFSENWKGLIDSQTIKTNDIMADMNDNGHRNLVDDLASIEKKENKNIDIMPRQKITFTTSDSTTYRQRTVDNAQATDITLAFAVDFSTAGERATKTAAGGKYYPVSIDGAVTPRQVASGIEDALVSAFGRADAKQPRTLNIAGNGLATLSSRGMTQERVNTLLYEALRIVTADGYRITSVRSGGQTGIDEAGIYAAARLGIPARVHTTRDWKWRAEDGVDRKGEADFKARYDYIEQLESVKDVEVRSLVNDLATEIAVGGDRFTPWDIAPRIASAVPEDGRQAFRDAVRLRYLETTPDDLHDEKGLAFLEDQINLWASDGQFALGRAILGMDLSDDELASAQRFRFVSPGVIAVSWDAGKEGATRDILFTKDGERINDGFILSDGAPGWEVGKDGILRATATVSEGRDAATLRRRDERQAVRVNAETGEVLEGRRTYRVFHGASGRNYAEERAVWAKIAALNGSEPSFNAFAKISEGVFSGYRMTGPATGEEVLFDADGYSLIGDAVIPTVPGPNRQQHGWGVRGGIIVARAVDGAGGEHEVRIDARTGKALALGEDRGAGVEPEDRRRAAAPPARENDLPSLYTLGLGRRSAKNFRSHIPKGTDIIIDARHYTTNENAPHFDATAIRATASGKGAVYEWHPELSGVPADRESKRRVRPLVSEVNVADDPKVVDYDRYAQTPEFRDGLERIEALVNEGKRVLVISGETDPAKCARGRLIGQALLRDGIRAVHIDDKNNLPRIRYQEDVVADAMRGSALVAGGPVDVGFLSNGKFNLHPGARVRRADVSTPASERIITDAAMDNYSNPVQFAESAEANPLNVVRENAAASDFTVVFTSMRGSASERAAVDAAGKVSSIKFYIPENREDLYDPERIARDAQRIMKKIRWAVASRPDGAVDMQSLRLNVQGSDMPHISARRVEGQVTNEELEKRRRDLGFRNETAGYKLDDMSGISQDDVNEYIYGILSYIQNAREVNAEFAEGEEPGQAPADIRIGTVLTDGNTGVAEAATLAAQRLQLRPVVQAPKGWRLTYDNETLMGREVRDEAMFKNRFRIGLAEENGLTAEQIDARAREADFRRAQGEDGMTPGLTDTQVAALHFLGYPNEQIIDMVDIAKDNAVVIDGPDSMLDFLESCAGYGICGADRLSTEKIREAFDYTADLVRRSLDKGINLVTVVSSDYPAGLRDMADYDIGDATPVYAVNNGVLSASMEGTRHRQTRPAILWVRGNLNLSDRPGVSAIGGGRWSERDAVRTGEALGAGLAEQDVALIANLFTGPQRAAVEAALEKGGQVTMLANGPIGGEETSDVEQKVVENDGAVISEDSIDEKPRTLDRNEKDRRNRISVALGAAAALIDHVNRLDATAVGELSAYTVGGMYFAVSAIIKNASKGKETIDEQGNGVEDLANAAKGVSPEEKAQKAVAASDPEYLREVEGELFPSQFTVPEIITSEGRRIFFIHEANYPEVVKALHDAYGDDILLENPRRYNEVLRRASLRTVEYGGGQVNLIGEEESTGTRIALPEPRESRVHFVNGAVYSTLTAPEFTTGLASRPARAEAAQLFERFQKEAVRIQNGLLAAVGLSGAPSVRFSNAYHITVSPEKVDVWHGEDLAASVKIGANGTVRVNDVEGTFFGMERPVLTEGTLNSMVNTLELWVLGKGPDRSEQYNLADREIRDEMDKNEESGYYEQLADNLETASRDVEEAVAKGRILDASDLAGDAQKAAKGLAFPKERAVALLLRERTAVEEKIAEVAKRQAAQEKAVEGAQLNYDNAVNAAAGSAQTSYAQDMLQAEKAKLEAVASERADLEKKRGWILLDIGSVANADKVQRIPGEKEDADTVTLYVDGRRVRTGNARLSAEEKAAGKSELEALRGGYRIYAGKDDVEFRKGLNAETRTLEYEAVPKGQAPSGGRKADTSEIIGDYVNGYYIVEREGKKAYADKHFNICSAWYDDLTPMGITCGCAKLTGPDGKQTLNMIRRDGCTPVLETWVDGIAVPQDGVAVVSKDGLFNYLNLETGELLFDEWKTEAYRFSNGWGVYRQGSDDFHPGTYMYVNREGLVVTDQIGYDACEDMKPEGAVAWSNGEAHRISPEGDDLGVVKVDFDVDTTEKLNEGRKGFTLKDLFFGQKK